LRLLCCPPDMVGDVWPIVRSMVAQAPVKTDMGSVSELDTDVLSGRALLWIVHSDERGIEAATVTRLDLTEHSKVCTILACGGAERSRWLQLLPEIENYAKAEGCDGVRLYGRRGWKRALPEYREIGVVMERKLR
jgi:hypothetical protein